VFLEIAVGTWPEARRLATALEGFVFRGQRCVDWSLQPSLERAGGDESGETVLLEEFQRRAHYVLPRVPERTERLEWLSIMRHHGVPTRLLDFTYSFYVGAFFALEDAASPSAIWCVRLRHPGASGRSSSSHRMRAERCLAGSAGPDASVFDVEPFHVPERMAAQRGLFLFPTRTDRPFMELLRRSLGIESVSATRIAPERLTAAIVRRASLVRILLAPEARIPGLHDLDDMGVTAASLFPGLEGFGRSLRTFLLPRPARGATDIHDPVKAIANRDARADSKRR